MLAYPKNIIFDYKTYKLYNQFMNKLPNGWTEYKLKDIMSISSKRYNPNKDTKNYKCIELEHIESETGILNGHTNSKDIHSVKNIFEKGEVLYGKLRPYLKKFYLAKFDGVCSSEIWVLKGKKVINDFLYYFIQQDNFNYIANVSIGMIMPRADWSYMSEISFNIPPLDEQKRIASALSKIDAYLENTVKLIEEKERFKRGIAKKLLTCKEGENIPEARFKGFEDEWEIVKLGDMFDNFKEKNNEDKIILASTIDKGVIPNSLTERKIIRKKESLSNYKLVKKGCFVISLMSFQSEFEYSDYEGIISPAYTVLKPKIEMAHYFYKYYFKSFKFIKDLRPYAEGIRHGKQIKFKACKDILVPYPSIEEQEKIGGYLSLLDKEIDNLKKQKELIKEMKRGAMQKLLSGEVRLLE